MTSIDFSLSNSLAPTFVVGADNAQSLEFGSAVVEGTMTVYYEDETLINKFLNETESSITVSVDDPTGSNAYTFEFPRVKYNGASVPPSKPSVSPDYTAIRGSVRQRREHKLEDDTHSLIPS